MPETAIRPSGQGDPAYGNLKSKFELLQQQIRLRDRIQIIQKRGYGHSRIIHSCEPIDPTDKILGLIKSTISSLCQEVLKLGKGQLSTTEALDVLYQLIDVHEGCGNLFEDWHNLHQAMRCMVDLVE